MLIQYEYDVLSYAASIATIRVDGKLSFLVSKLNDELGENLELYIKKLKTTGFIDDSLNRVIINTDYWLSFFCKLLQSEFKKNNLKVRCELNKTSKEIEFNINGSKKIFYVIFNKGQNGYIESKDCIYMCKTYEYDDDIYWLDLLNDVNLITILYKYIINEVTYINKTVYKTIDNLEGLTSSHVSEIFNNSIKKYFLGKDYNNFELDDCEAKNIKRLMLDDNISFYAMKKNNNTICIIKKKDIIVFLELNKSKVYYSEIINKEINELKKKLDAKVSQYRSLVMYKDNNVLDTTIKLTTQLVTYTAPFTMIISILALLNIKVSKLIQYKWVLIIAIILLGIIQILIFMFIYLPGYKVNRFKWDIK